MLGQTLIICRGDENRKYANRKRHIEENIKEYQKCISEVLKWFKRRHGVFAQS